MFNMFKVGDLVRVDTKRYGWETAIIVKPYYSSAGCEWVVSVVADGRRVICCPSDLEVISENR